MAAIDVVDTAGAGGIRVAGCEGHAPELAATGRDEVEHPALPVALDHHRLGCGCAGALHPDCDRVTEAAGHGVGTGVGQGVGST